MGFLDRIFGKKTPPVPQPASEAPTPPLAQPVTQPQSPGQAPKQESKEPPMATEEAFERAFRACLPRYMGRTDAQIKFDMKSPEGEVLRLADAFPETFQEWTQIRSVQDQRCLIFEEIDKIFGERLTLWQWMNRLIETREPQAAYEMAEKATEADLADANYWAVYARILFVLGRYADAEASAHKGLALNPEHPRSLIALGDALYFGKKDAEAQEAWGRAMKLSPLQTMNDSGGKITLSFGQLVSFQDNILYSPAYAIVWLTCDPDAPEEAWEWASGEFYFSPQFRCQHAYYLIKQGNHMKAFAKLLTVAKDMPWYKEAVINSYNLIDQLGIRHAVTKDEQYLAQVMRDNNWSADGAGMHVMEI